MMFDRASSIGRWDAFFMEMAFLMASKSKDRSVKVGAVAKGEGHRVLEIGYNGFIRNANDDVDARHERPEKYDWTVHAEANVVYNAARSGTALLGATLYTSSHPCKDCAKAIVQAGFVEVVVSSKEDDPFWKAGRWGDWEENFEKGREILLNGQVRVVDHVIQ